MNIYTKGGDKGTTSLVHTKNVSKSDDRIQLVGTIDELTSHLGLVKTMLKDEDTIQFLEKIQRTLITVMAGGADPYKRDYRIDDVKTEYLEDEINRMEGLFQRPKEFILPGKCRLSAEMDVARTVARRAERALATVSVKFFIYLPDILMQRWRKCLLKRWINRQKKHRTVEKMRSEPWQRTRIRQEQSMKL